MQLRVSQVEGITYKYRLYIRFSSVLNAYYVSFSININIYKHETQFITMLYSYFNYFTIQNSASELFFGKPWPYFVTDFSQPLKARMLKLRCRGSSLGNSSIIKCFYFSKITHISGSKQHEKASPQIFGQKKDDASKEKAFHSFFGHVSLNIYCLTLRIYKTKQKKEIL